MTYKKTQLVHDQLKNLVGHDQLKNSVGHAQLKNSVGHRCYQAYLELHLKVTVIHLDIHLGITGVPNHYDV